MPTTKLERMLFIPDTHIPYHDARALALVQSVAKAYRPKWLVLLGDFADFYKVSFHSKDPARLERFEDELAKVSAELRKFEKWCTDKRIYVEGNHEYRLHRYLSEKAPELYGLIMNQDFLGLNKHGWIRVPYKTDYQIGRLFVTHDVGQSGIHSTRQAMHSYQDNCVIGHNHRLDYHVQGNAKGVPHVGASFGWLGDVEKIDYMHAMKARSNWAAGFGWGHLTTTNGFVYLQPIPIINYTCCVEGRLFTN